MEYKNRYTLFIIVVILIIGLIGSLILLNRGVTFQGRAFQRAEMSMENSYIFASPLLACADGLSRVRVTVFILDTQGLGLSGEKVHLINPSELTIDGSTDVTDYFGKSYFDVLSSTAGKFQVGARVLGTELPQKVDLLFNDSSSCSSR